MIGVTVITGNLRPLNRKTLGIPVPKLKCNMCGKVGGMIAPNVSHLYGRYGYHKWTYICTKCHDCSHFYESDIYTQKGILVTAIEELEGN